MFWFFFLSERSTMQLTWCAKLTNLVFEAKHPTEIQIWMISQITHFSNMLWWAWDLHKNSAIHNLRVQKVWYICSICTCTFIEWMNIHRKRPIAKTKLVGKLWSDCPRDKSGPNTRCTAQHTPTLQDEEWDCTYIQIFRPLYALCIASLGR